MAASSSLRQEGAAHVACLPLEVVMPDAEGANKHPLCFGYGLTVKDGCHRAKASTLVAVKCCEML